MPAYFVIDLNIPNEEKLKEYERGASVVFKKHGGKVLTRAGEGDYDVIEGDWRPKRLVIIEFPDRQSIHDFYNDPDFAAMKALRHSVPGMTANALAVEGG
jgi:uncharacterized protein (DUF1330 family)